MVNITRTTVEPSAEPEPKASHVLPPAISSGLDLLPLSEYKLVHKVPTIRLAGEEESKVISEEIELVIRTRVTQIKSLRNRTYQRTCGTC